MTIFHSNSQPLPPVPDSLTVPQFILDTEVKTTDPRAPTKIPCFIEELTGRKIYLDELRSKTEYFARGIKAKWNIGEGSVVSIFSPNHIDYPFCIWGVHRLGGIVAPMSFALGASELVHQLKLVETNVIISHIEGLPVVLKAAASVGILPSQILVLGAPNHPQFPSVDDILRAGKIAPGYVEQKMNPGEGKTKIAFFNFSSGTTGLPKAVAISHFNLICNVLQFTAHNRIHEDYAPWEERRFRPGDVCTGVVPFFHIYGLVVNIHLVIYSKMTAVLAEKFDFAQMVDSIKRYQITHLWIAPPQAVLFCKHPAMANADISSIRFCMVAGAPVSSELSEQFVQVMPNIHFGQAYGMTETCAAVSMFPLEPRVGTMGSAGQSTLVSGTIGKVVKSDGSLAKAGEAGELWVKGGQNTLGYYKNEKATKEDFIDGWVRTGDHVLFEPNGDLFIVDRIKEFLKVKGLQVAPAELEGHLLDHPNIADAAIIGVPDDYAGELPRAYVALHAELSEKVQRDKQLEAKVRTSIFKHVADAKARYKWLEGGIVFVDAVPKTPSGKILRRMFRDQLAAESKKVKANL
ncbi:phenylacetyl-CoA ligase [Dendrothele bispora CBS 962.96]|uniref:Phenylacetyl-CoA ligase n=1 Tax=Dendrothele bispora (strain CBS 962.96) TaxID=1314807 RepID=A0A4V4HG24_DENBC|nr:phenylacetyl-CoA ligase [Dendrothele bispora CBS 962.96]